MTRTFDGLVQLSLPLCGFVLLSTSLPNAGSAAELSPSMLSIAARGIAGTVQDDGAIALDQSRQETSIRTHPIFRVYRGYRAVEYGFVGAALGAVAGYFPVRETDAIDSGMGLGALVGGVTGGLIGYLTTAAAAREEIVRRHESTTVRVAWYHAHGTYEACVRNYAIGGCLAGAPIAFGATVVAVLILDRRNHLNMPEAQAITFLGALCGTGVGAIAGYALGMSTGESRAMKAGLEGGI